MAEVSMAQVIYLFNCFTRYTLAFYSEVKMGLSSDSFIKRRNKVANRLFKAKLKLYCCHHSITEIK